MWNVILVALVHGARSIGGAEARAEVQKQLDALEQRRQAIIERLASEYDLATRDGLRAAENELAGISGEYEITPVVVSISLNKGYEPQTQSHGSQFVGLSFALECRVGDETVPPEGFSNEIVKAFLSQKRPKGLNTITLENGRASIVVETDFVAALASAKSVLELALRVASNEVCAQLSEYCSTHNTGVRSQIDVVRKQIYAVHNAMNFATSSSVRQVPMPKSNSKIEEEMRWKTEQLQQGKSAMKLGIGLVVAFVFLIAGSMLLRLFRDPIAASTDFSQVLAGKPLRVNEHWQDGWTQGRLDSYEIACINGGYKAQASALLGMNDKEKKAAAAQLVSWCSCVAALFAKKVSYDGALRDEAATMKNLEATGETQNCRRKADVAAEVVLHQ